MRAGLDQSTPVVSVQWGTRPEQRTVRTTLGGLADAPVESPATIVIGPVAALDLAWFERRPLFGRRIVVTRAREQASDLVHQLHDLGAETVELPAIAVVDPADGGAALRAAADAVSSYDWVVFTSANAVARFVPLLRDARALGSARVAAIGPGTAERLADANIAADLVPDRFVAEGLLEAFPSGTGRVLLPRAAVARDVLPDGLQSRGWEVDVVEAYRTEKAAPSTAALEAARHADAVTFTSSSTVTNYLEVAGADGVPPVVACIGPVTADAARTAGLDVTIEAETHTVEGLVDALLRWFAA
jgi:uroporphyrinogen III methyltransferase/synthase